MAQSAVVYKTTGLPLVWKMVDGRWKRQVQSSSVEGCVEGLQDGRRRSVARDDDDVSGDDVDRQKRNDVEDEVEGAAGVALDNDVDDDENTLFWQHVTGATTVCQDAALDKDVNHEGDDADERVGPRCDDDEV